eukprot:TRINITY_DN109686_c0_g1_i1.p1 TRINITY_DN109686_c0_g1~~TRINITY_DN109686_c0_g1_i1.p1  ORF type:complete len:299 (+),score=54.68 TRINITY_DN109686_c0_g1_i1:78-899(+)
MVQAMSCNFRVAVALLSAAGLAFAIGVVIGASNSQSQLLRDNPKEMGKHATNLAESNNKLADDLSKIGQDSMSTLSQLGQSDPTVSVGPAKDQWRKDHLLMVSRQPAVNTVTATEDIKFVKYEVEDGQKVKVNDPLLLGRVNGTFVAIAATADGSVALNPAAKVSPGEVIAKGTPIATISVPAGGRSLPIVLLLCMMLLAIITVGVASSYWSSHRSPMEANLYGTSEAYPQHPEHPLMRVNGSETYENTRLLSSKQQGALPGMPRLSASAARA